MSKSSVAKQTAGWVFTIYDYDDNTKIYLKKLPYRFLCFGDEICPKTNRPHLQGYILFEKKRRFNGVQNILPVGAHIEAAGGTAEDNAFYTSKEGKWFMDGVPPEQGKRNDINSVKEIIDAGGQLVDCFERAFGTTCRFHKAFEKYIQLKSKHRDGGAEVIWLWGPTGVGKTKYAYEIGGRVYPKDGTRWWDDYLPGDIILIDDFDGQWPFRDLLRLLDRYPYQGQVKGGYVKINSDYIVITCEHPPQKFWQDSELAQVLRRITQLKFVGGDEHTDELEHVGEKKVLGNTKPALFSW